MITFACSACQKKLSVKDELAGKKGKCPACGRSVAVPSRVAAAPAKEEMATVPPAPADRDERTNGLTHPPSSNPDLTQGGNKPDAGHDSSLTDFLSPPQADDELGRLGKYRILKVLGHGGMGVVFQAEDPALKRSVAIKAMLPTLAASASAGKRFLREAQAMAAVEHDHIVRIYQVDEERGVPFLAMELLKGEPLDERLKRDGKLPLAEVLRIGREIAEALAAAHATGLIHRDVKPANIWLEAPRNRVKILDFGLARAVSEDAGLTQQGAIVGTPAYMAPEQGRGEAVDGRCDLFSLGVVLYRLCTGQQPFKGKDTISTMMEVALHQPPPPRQMNAETPQELSDLVMQLLEKDAALRPASAGVVVEMLQGMEKKRARAQESADHTLAPSTASIKRAAVPGKQGAAAGSSRPAPPRRALALVAAAAAALALVAAGIVLFWQTPSGTVRIEINDPDIQVAFDNKDLIFKGVEKQDLKVSPGAHGLHVKRKDLEFDTDKPILVKKGETITLKIEWLKDGKLQVVQGDKVIGARTVPPVQYALAFDGIKARSRVVIPSWSYQGKHPLTVEAWAVLQRRADDPANEHLMGDPEVAGFSIGSVGKAVDGDKWSFHLYLLTKGAYVGARGKLPLPRNQLIHVAGVYAPQSEIRFYVNGQLQEKTPAKGRYRPSPVPFTLGANPGLKDTFSDHFLGRMQGVRISRVARYDKDFTPARRFEPDTDTVALYRFDEGRGDKLTDSSGNNHHGKIVGARWVKADGSPVESPTYPLLDPAWLKRVAAMPAKEQWKAVAEILKERNPGFDGKGKEKIEGGAVTELRFVTDQITDISPIRALTGLRSLTCSGTEIDLRGQGKLADLSPLKDMKLTKLDCQATKVSDLTPLKDMKLTSLNCWKTKVSDLSPLKHMKLTYLNCGITPVADLSPLKDMKLTVLYCQYTRVSDLSPLKDMKLTFLTFQGTRVSDLSPLKDMKLTELNCWKTKVSDLSPVKNVPLTMVNCSHTQVSDLSPLKDMKLTGLYFDGAPVSDLSPLKDMKLTALHCEYTNVSDLSPLKNMKLTSLWCDNAKVTDLSPLRGMPLKDLRCDFKPERDAEILRSIKTLEKINDKPAKGFWQEVAAKKLKTKP